MPPLKGVSSANAPADLLRLALEAESPEQRASYAERGLASAELDAPDTRFLLLRQLYLAHMEQHRFRDALDVTAHMAAQGPMVDIAHNDASRAWLALGDADRAIEAQRLAARSAPPDRRSFQYWSLGNLLHQQGDLAGATGALTKGERWAREDRALIRAHQAWIEIASGRAVEDIDAITRTLEHSKAGKGIGRLILGMIAYELGDRRAAAIHLRAFLRRNAALDAVKELSMREELRVARTALAAIESD